MGIGESGFASSLYVIYSELNRHGISRKRENAEYLAQARECRGPGARAATGGREGAPRGGIDDQKSLTPYLTVHTENERYALIFG